MCEERIWHARRYSQALRLSLLASNVMEYAIYMLWYVGACTLGTQHVYWHGITEYIQHGIGLYTNVHLSLYTIYIIARTGMHNIWVWKSTVMYIHTYYIMYNTHAVLRFARIYLQLYII